MLLREIALRERDPRLLESVYAAGAAGLARDRAEIARLRASGRRLDGLRLPVKVFDAYRPGNGSWVVVARVGRSPARLVTGSGRQVRATKATAAVYRCTLVQRNGSWRLLRPGARLGPAGHSRYSRVALVARMRRAVSRAAASSRPPASTSARSTRARARRQTVAPHQCDSG